MPENGPKINSWGTALLLVAGSGRALEASSARSPARSPRLLIARRGRIFRLRVRVRQWSFAVTTVSNVRDTLPSGTHYPERIAPGRCLWRMGHLCGPTEPNSQAE